MLIIPPLFFKKKQWRYCVCLHPSILSYHYLLLNHWEELNQTCYMTFPHGKGVSEQHYFSDCRAIRRPTICQSHYLIPNYWAEFNQTCNMISFHGKGMREWVCPSVHLSVMLLATLTRESRALRCFVCVEVIRPSQTNGVMLSAVSLPNHTFTGQA